MLTKRDAPTWGSTPTKDRVVVPPKDDTRGHKASEVLRSPSRVRDVLHLVHRSHSFERRRLDLAHALAWDCEAAADLLERLRFAVAEACGVPKFGAYSEKSAICRQDANFGTPQARSGTRARVNL
jgi:hypothetical protein